MADPLVTAVCTADLQNVLSKLDHMQNQECSMASVAARDAAAIRQDVNSGAYTTRGDVQDSKYQIHDNIVRQGTDIAKNFGIIDKSISTAFASLDREQLLSERRLEATVRHGYDHVQAQLATMAKDAALCCCETKGLIKDTKCELQAIAAANQAVLMAEFCKLSHQMEKGFMEVDRKDLQRDFDAKQAHFVALQAEMSNLKQTATLIEALKKGA